LVIVHFKDSDLYKEFVEVVETEIELITLIDERAPVCQRCGKATIPVRVGRRVIRLCPSGSTIGCYSSRPAFVESCPDCSDAVVLVINARPIGRSDDELYCLNCDLPIERNSLKWL